jgi:hypothetical protein
MAKRKLKNNAPEDPKPLQKWANMQQVQQPDFFSTIPVCLQRICAVQHFIKAFIAS